MAVDGIRPLRRLFGITLPLVTPALLVNLVLGLIGNFQIFTAGFVITTGRGGPGALTLGGPGPSSLFYVLYLYQNAFTRFRFGYASALAWVLFALLLALTRRCCHGLRAARGRRGAGRVACPGEGCGAENLRQASPMAMKVIASGMISPL